MNPVQNSASTVKAAVVNKRGAKVVAGASVVIGDEAMLSRDIKLGSNIGLVFLVESNNVFGYSLVHNGIASAMKNVDRGVDEVLGRVDITAALKERHRIIESRHVDEGRNGHASSESESNHISSACRKPQRGM
jgi:hypothetical protein